MAKKHELLWILGGGALLLYLFGSGSSQAGQGQGAGGGAGGFGGGAGGGYGGGSPAGGNYMPVNYSPSQTPGNIYGA